MPAGTALARTVLADYFGLHTGLLELDGRPKPGLAAFAETVRAMIAP